MSLSEGPRKHRRMDPPEALTRRLQQLMMEVQSLSSSWDDIDKTLNKLLMELREIQSDNWWADTHDDNGVRKLLKRIHGNLVLLLEVASSSSYQRKYAGAGGDLDPSSSKPSLRFNAQQLIVLSLIELQRICLVPFLLSQDEWNESCRVLVRLFVESCHATKNVSCSLHEHLLQILETHVANMTEMILPISLQQRFVLCLVDCISRENHNKCSLLYRLHQTALRILESLSHSPPHMSYAALAWNTVMRNERQSHCAADVLKEDRYDDGMRTELFLFEWQCRTRLPRDSSTTTEQPLLMCDHDNLAALEVLILKESSQDNPNPLCHQAMDCLLEMPRRPSSSPVHSLQTLVRLLLESPSPTIKKRAVYGIHLLFSTADCNQDEAYLLLSSVDASHYERLISSLLQVVHRQQNFTYEEASNDGPECYRDSITAATKLLLMIVRFVAPQRKHESISSRYLAKIRSQLLHGATQQQCPQVVSMTVRALCQDLLRSPVDEGGRLFVEESPEVLSVLAVNLQTSASTQETKQTIVLFFLELLQLRRPTILECFSTVMARQPVVVEAVAGLALADDSPTRTRRLAASVLFLLSSNVCNWRFLARKSGVLAAMVKSVQAGITAPLSFVGPREVLKERIHQLATVL